MLVAQQQNTKKKKKRQKRMYIYVSSCRESSGERIVAYCSAEEEASNWIGLNWTEKRDLGSDID